MKTLGVTRIGAIALLFCAQITSALAITFTHDTFISFADHSHEGDDLVATNCTLTVDGTHAFNSLRLQNGAVLTHSPFPYGPQQFTFSISDEAQVLSAITPATLNNPDVDLDTVVVMDTSASVTYTENVDYVITFSNQFIQLTLTTNSAIAEGATILVDYDWVQSFQGFNLTIASDMQVTAGSAINLSGKGYIGGIGFGSGAGTSHATNFPFAFTGGGGGGHGGSGGMSSTFARGGASYDSTTNPTSLGSGGGAGSADGGAGGGVGILSVGGNLQIDGLLIADGLKGTNAHSGGGAGGSILIAAQGFFGAGTISAKGGSADLPDGGGGGGGRIAIYSITNNFTGNISAFGGAGANYGGAGTIYLQSPTNSAGQLFIVNGGKRGTNTSFSAAISDLTISGGAVAQSQNSTFSITNLFVGSNSWLISPDTLPLTLTVNGDANLESNAMINADFKSLSGTGAGSAVCGSGSGGSYGGFGGASACGAPGGNMYGVITEPSLFGSPGGAGVIARGGGAIHMTVSGTLSLAGNISANGAPAPTPTSGGGSGGSVWVIANALLGNGTISANGGSAGNLVGGGGGGGRVAVYFDTNLFMGSITSRGGDGINAGGAGTVYIQSGGTPALPSPSSLIRLIVDNGGLTGFTALPSSLSPPYDLNISGGAVLTNFGITTANLRTLFIGSNSWFTAQASSTPSLNVHATNVVIQPGGGMTTDGQSSSLVGAGQSALSQGLGWGGGGGNGGNGGAGVSNANGGSLVGVITTPGTFGGIGGAGFQNGSGGKGGGAIFLSVSGILQLNGTVSANGTTGPGFNSGGGAGGSISLLVGTISGAGTISANGGAANNTLGGGGGGGRIGVSYATNLFTGGITAYGGAGTNFGGAGTIYTITTRPIQGKTPQQVTLDNGGTRGAVTAFSNVPNTYDLTVIGGASLSNTVSAALTIGNLLVGSNSVLQTSPQSQQSLTVASNVTVLAGGSINADGLNAGSSGQGQTLNATGGGGGNAGTGGPSALNALGGNAFSDSLTSPSSVGSRGGAGFNGQLLGGNGGGSLRMTVGGTLQVNGKISAEGAASLALNGGGGSGGAVVLSANRFSGTGIISANGGAGNAGGGGGGGGRIAIWYTSNLFTGTLTARGGSGANYGGAGLIFTAPTPSIDSFAAKLILDNGGVQGGYTPLFTSPPSNIGLTVTGGAILSNNIVSQSTLSTLFIGSNSTYLSFVSSPQILTVLTNATIQTGGILTLDGISSSGAGLGQTLNSTGGGGGHGGYGGASRSNALGGNVTSDSITSPSTAGSRGGDNGGNGGGALQLTVRGALQLDGKLSVNGVTGSIFNSGGGSGGAMWLSVGKLLGTGSISANGGAGNNIGGGGGGGRIAIWYNTNQFTGSVTARGGGGGNFGGAGTIYTTANFSGQSRFAQLIVDNGGFHGTNTLVSSKASGGADFVVGNGASATISESTTFWNSLTISSNASFGFDPTANTTTLTITSNLTVQAGGTIMLDGEGFPAGSGQGHGFYTISSGSGAGHGGYGSQGTQSGIGGISYDPISGPTQPGSGGGSLPNFPFGSAGGGAIRLIVNGTLAVNGTISANGKSALSSGAGGGSGGSLWLNAGTFSGTGKISVDGGDGELFAGGGGGGGGRIAVFFYTNQFVGTFSAHGGFGPFLSGGAGTVYLKTNSASVGQLILNNNGEKGTNTPLGTPAPPFTLSVNNGAAANTISPLTVQDLFIGPSGVFNANPATLLTLTVLGNAQVSPGGAINADALGNNPNLSFNSGTVDSFGDGSGGGYGGAGGASLFGAPGGTTYGSLTQPSSFGSAGGVSPLLPGFSQGGGAIRLKVNGNLTLSGSISANGNDGVIDGSGGGSGGSIWITAQSISGNGWLTADGGMGESGEGGGGGGGRIALYAVTNAFLGNIFASGGEGAFPGQDGTIYFGTNLLVSGTVIGATGMAAAGIPLQPSGLSSVTTDVNGYYAVAVPPAWSGFITPSTGTNIFVPASRTYSNLATSAQNQNFVAAIQSDFNLNDGQFDGTNVNFNWFGINGVSYQPEYSTNLADWLPYGAALIGNNTPAVLALPTTNGPIMFFRLGVSY